MISFEHTNDIIYHLYMISHHDIIWIWYHINCIWYYITSVWYCIYDIICSGVAINTFVDLNKLAQWGNPKFFRRMISYYDVMTCDIICRGYHSINIYHISVTLISYVLTNDIIFQYMISYVDIWYQGVPSFQMTFCGRRFWGAAAGPGTTISTAKPFQKSIENVAYNSERPHRFGLV